LQVVNEISEQSAPQDVRKKDSESEVLVKNILQKTYPLFIASLCQSLINKHKGFFILLESFILLLSENHEGSVSIFAIRQRMRQIFSNFIKIFTLA